VHPDDRPYEKLIRGHDPAVVPAYRRLTGACTRTAPPCSPSSTTTAASPAGRTRGGRCWRRRRSPTRCSARVPKEITAAEIDGAGGGYALVARHCAEGGFDGVELQCSQASILRQFLSPLTNHRTDAYGGRRSRRRALLEVLAAVRAAPRPGPGGRRAVCAATRACPAASRRPSGADGAARGAPRRLRQHHGRGGHRDAVPGRASMHTPAGYALGIRRRWRPRCRSRSSGSAGSPGSRRPSGRSPTGHCDLVGWSAADRRPGFAAGPSRTMHRVQPGVRGPGSGSTGRWELRGEPAGGREAVPLPRPGRPAGVLVAGGGRAVWPRR
jgi:2,4-dienoyl-CoA reductase (NADPH2)